MQVRKAKQPRPSRVATKLPGLPGPVMAQTAPNPADLAALVDRLNRGFEEFKQKNDAALAEVRNRGSADVTLREQVDRIGASVGGMQGAVDELRAQLAAARAGGGIADNGAPAIRAHREAFERWMRRGVEPANMRTLEVQAALNTESDPDGGFLVPDEYDSAITRVVSRIAAMRQLASTITIGGNTWRRLHNLGGTASGWVGERASRPETVTPTLVEQTFAVHEIYANPAATQTALDDARLSLEQWLAGEVSVEFAEQEGAGFISGNGVNKPFGLFSATKVANASYAWGKIGYVVTGSSGAFATAGFDNMVDLVHSLKPAYRGSASWLMNDLTLASVRKLKDTTNQYIWQPSPSAGAPATILEKPYAIDDNCSDIAANSYSIAFGDFRKAYLIVDRTGTRVLRDPFTNKPFVHFYTTRRVGGGIMDYAAVKFLKFGTS